MKSALIAIIKFYQKTISPDQGFLRRIQVTRTGTCVFYPTCSQYTIEAIDKYGVLRGTIMGVRRVLCCHPWQKNNIDPLV
ncbi:MAG: membrane protein insertion efficiency factor YidD [bacterium]|nr:membrane protein insertion efficiency factor YidD [bacterium]